MIKINITIIDFDICLAAFFFVQSLTVHTEAEGLSLQMSSPHL